MLVSAVIPAYNEENTIGDVLDVLADTHDVDEIIVVSDGSTDKTADIARQKGTYVIEFDKNMGKGAAVNAGLKKCSGEIILLLDADLIGLKEEHINELLKPVLENEVDMTVGVFHNGRFSTDFAQKVCPYLSGQRAIKKSVLEDMRNIDKMGYGIEIALTVYGESNGIRKKEIGLKDITHVMKEEKLGIFRGFTERLKMYWQIYRGIRLSRR